MSPSLEYNSNCITENFDTGKTPHCLLLSTEVPFVEQRFPIDKLLLSGRKPRWGCSYKVCTTVWEPEISLWKKRHVKEE